MTLDEIREAVIAAAPYASHYYSVKKGESYTTWHEYQRIPLKGDGKTAEDAWAFQVDHFTKREDDPAPEAIFAALDGNDRIAVDIVTICRGFPSTTRPRTVNRSSP